MYISTNSAHELSFESSSESPDMMRAAEFPEPELCDLLKWERRAKRTGHLLYILSEFSPQTAHLKWYKTD